MIQVHNPLDFSHRPAYASLTFDPPLATKPVIMTDYKAVCDAIVSHPRYKKNLDLGEPRSGHPEGTVRAHIAELELNLDKLKPKLSDTDFWKLKILIHVHDSFKNESQIHVPIIHPGSHASLAREFLSILCDDPDLLAMVQYHDEPFAIWRQIKDKGKYNRERLDALLQNIKDWNLFLAFNIIDGCTKGKRLDCHLVWLFGEVADKVQSVFSATDIL